MKVISLILFHAALCLWQVHSGSCDSSWLNPMFKSGMILQKAPHQPLMWGTGNPEEQVRIEVFDPTGQLVIEAGAMVQEDGKWTLLVPPQDPGTGYRIVVLKEYGSDEEVIELNDVAFGDIWLCSGQSNMEFQMQSVFDAENEINEIIKTTPEMRLFHVKHKTSPDPIEDLEDGDIQYNWGKAGDGGPNLRTFAAICALFGNYQQQKLGYPIGLIESSWGGTFIEPWSTPEGLETCEIPPDHQNQDQAKNNYLFNAMIHPLMKFSIEGAIWYQGENNAGYPGDYHSYNLDKYSCAFREMIGEWRRYWHEKTFRDTDDKFPFGFVQLAAYIDQRDHYEWPKLRYHQTHDYSFVPNEMMENTFMAVAMDTNDPEFDALHPPHKREPAMRLAMAGYHQHYLQNSFDQPRVVRACQIPNDRNDLNSSADIVQFQLSHQITLTQNTNAKGFSACCERDYELCNKAANWIDLEILEVSDDGLNVDVDIRPAIEYCTDWDAFPGAFGYMWMETPCPTLLDCQLYVIGCDQLTENCDDQTMKFPVTPWFGGFSDECVI